MIKCPICNKEMKVISSSHLKTHNITMKEFRLNYPHVELSSRETKDKMSKATVITNNIRWTNYHISELPEKELYEANPKLCECCQTPIPFKNRNRHISCCSRSCATTVKNRKNWLIAKSDITHPWVTKKVGFMSKGERKLLEYLKLTYPQFIWKRQKHIEIKGIIRVIDIYCEDLKLFIEYDGKMHFAPIFGDKRFELTKNGDELLNDEAISGKFKLIRINERTFYYGEWKQQLDDLITQIEVIPQLNYLYLLKEV